MSGVGPMLVFVHLNKTAGRTMRYILRASYGARHCDVEAWDRADPAFSAEDLRRVRKLYPRLASIAGHRVTGYVDLDDGKTDLRYMTLMRDPIATCASRFQYQLDFRKKEDLGFEEWIQKDWVRDAQTQRIGGTTNAGDAIAVIEKREMFVGLTERFDESMVLLKNLRAPDLDIDYAQVNVAKRSTVARQLLDDPTTRQMIVEANRADLELYGYVQRELYPSFRTEFGPSLDEAVAGYVRTRREGFRRGQLARYALRQRMVYRPMLRLYRSRIGRRPAELLLR